MSKALNVFSFVRLRPSRRGKAGRRESGRTSSEDLACAEIIARSQPQIFCEELQDWARRFFEAKHAARREQLAHQQEQNQ